MSEVLNLFQGASRTPAVVLSLMAFVLGAAAMCLCCRRFSRPCSRRSYRKPAASAPRREAKGGEEKPFEKRKPHPAPADGSIEIYVGNLSYDMTEEQLRKEFEAYGTVNSARIITNRYNGKSKGFGFVHMPNRAEADAAVAALNDKEVLGRPLKCNEAKNLI